MAVQFAQPYRFTEQQFARMAEAGILPRVGTHLVEGVPYRAGAPIRFSRAAFYQLGEFGILGKADRVERVEGEILQMSPIGSRHSACVTRVNRFLTPRVGDALVRFENPIALPQDIDPQPDIAVVRPRDDDYEDSHPTADDALIVIEVADSTVAFDRTVKAQWYAEAEIPEYWLVDLIRRRVIVHQLPVTGEYRDVRVYNPGESWTSAAIAGLEIPVDAFLRRR